MRKLNSSLCFAAAVTLVTGNLCFAVPQSTYGPPASIPQIPSGSVLDQLTGSGMTNEQMRQMLIQQGMPESVVDQMLGTQGTQTNEPEALPSVTPPANIPSFIPTPPPTPAAVPEETPQDQVTQEEVTAEQPPKFQTFDEFIEYMTTRISTKYSEKLAPQIIEQVLPEIETMAGKINKSVLSQEINIDGFTASAPQNAIGNLPSAEVIAGIPDENLDMARASAYASIEQGIESGFANSTSTTSEEVSRIVTTVIPKIKVEIKSAVERILPKINDIIENNMDTEIDAELTDVVSGISDILPTDMEELSPDELVDRLVDILQPKVEGAMRPTMETKIRDAIDQVVNEKIEKPINEKMQPLLDNLNSEGYNETIDQLPSYLERVVSKDFIKQTVQKQIERLKSEVPEMVSGTKTTIRNDIDKFIDNEINQKNKVYLNNSKISAIIKTKIQKNTLLGSLNETVKQLGAKTKWNLSKKTCTITKGSKTVVIDFKAGTAKVDGKTTKVPTTFSKNNGMVPLEFLATSLGFEVEKQADWNMLTITK